MRFIGSYSSLGKFFCFGWVGFVLFFGFCFWFGCCFGLCLVWVWGGL